MTASVPASLPVRQPAYLLVPLGVGAVVATALGVYGRVHTPAHRALFGLSLSGMFSMKVWVTAAALVLALVQLVTALWMYGKLGRPAPKWVGPAHRASGTVAFLLTLPVAYHCLWSLGFAPAPFDTRTLAHSLLGCLFYGAFTTKLLTLHSRRVPVWALPWVAGLLLTVLVAVGLTSAVWYFVTIGVPS
jgi:hypothetical protein